MNSGQNIADRRIADYNLLSKQPSVNNPYFLTHQSANLMEDFAREIDRSSSLFLLYGTTGVGKSRLLAQFRTQRLSEVNSHWVDFNQATSNNAHPVDLALELKQLAEEAATGDVIFIDHFEAGSNKAQHQLFESWSVDGRDKKLNIIVAADSTGFDAFRQLAQQFHIEARSFQLMPCNDREAHDYLQSILFPEEPFGNLIIPGQLKKQVQACRGVFASLAEFAERDGAKITIDVHAREKSNYLAVTIISLLTLALIVGGYLVYSSQSGKAKTSEAVINGSNVEKQNIVGETIVVTESQQSTQVTEQEAREVVAPAITAPTEIAETIPEPIEPPVKTPANAEVDAVLAVEPEKNWFDSMLETSTAWIKNGDSKRGTIQIMSISIDRLSPTALENYLQTMKAKKIDITQLHIFKSSPKNSKVYSIVYGEFASWREAGLQIKTLPEVLAANKPYPRTTGSISKEMSRLANQ